MRRTELLARLRRLETGTERAVPYFDDDRDHDAKLAELRQRNPGATFALPRGREFDEPGFVDLFA